MKDPAHAQKILAELKERGLALAIDDYGTGQSSAWRSSSACGSTS